MLPETNLPWGQVDHAAAALRRTNVLQELTYVPKTLEVYEYLSVSKSDIEALTAHHLGLDRTQCVMSDYTRWIRGEFNTCIPVEVKSRDGKPSQTVLMRCPMPHRFRDIGCVDEKIGCEVATYAWIQEHCPEIKIPHLLGFGFTDGRSYTHASYRPWYVRVARSLKRGLCSALGFQAPSRYVRHASWRALTTGYVLLQYIEPSEGQILAQSWNKHRDDPVRRKNLFTGIARTTLALARVPLPRIGSFTFRDDGTVTLSNRPLTCHVAILECYGVPRAIEQDTTYDCVDPYISDLLDYQDHRFLSQPNSAFDVADGQKQMATKALIRGIGHHFRDRKLRNGPYALAITDLHQGNIFVDDDWNITYIIDLEWACSLPVDMIGAPSWLTGRWIDQMHGEALEEYDTVRQEYMRVFEEEEDTARSKIQRGRWQGRPSLTEVMQAGWKRGTYWYYLCLTSVNSIYTIAPLIYAKYHMSDLANEDAQTLSRLWDQESKLRLDQKLADKADYDKKLKVAFEMHLDQGDAGTHDNTG